MTTATKKAALRVVAASTALLAVALLAAAAQGARRPARGGAIRLPTVSPIHSLDPTAIRWPAESTIASMLYDSPYRLSLSGRPRPHLLHPVTSLGGGRTLRLKVRPHAVFHDGSPIRASHVVASLRRLAKSREHGWLMAMVEGTVKSGPSGLQVTGTNTVEIKLRTARGLELLVMALSTSQAGVVPSSRKASRGVGSGPFLLRGRKGTDRILRANRDYFDGPPYLGEIRLLGPTGRDDHIRRFQLERADASWMGDSVYGEPPPIKGVTAVAGPPSLLVYLVFNTSRGKTRDLPLRRAVDLALDRRRLAATTAEPLGLPGAKVPAPEPARARSLIGGLGFDASSRPLVLLVEEADAFGVALAPLIQRDLSAVGLPVDRVVTSPAETRGRLTAGNWDMRLQTSTPVSPNEVLQLGQALALGGLHSDARRLVQRAPHKQRSEMARAVAVLKAQLPVIPLVRRRPRFHHRTSLRGVAFDSIGRLALADLWLRTTRRGAGGR